MHPRNLALIAAVAALAAGCVSNETKPESTPVTATSSAQSPVEKPAQASTATQPGKPECVEDTGSKKKSKKDDGKKDAAKAKSSKKGETTAVDCEPAKAKTAGASPSAPAAEPAPPPAKEAAKPAEAGKPRVVKSRDGTFEGEIYGNIPPGSKWAKLQIGMEQPEVERILGVSNDVHAYPTAKAFIPFYYGTDRHRYEVRYPGQGSVSYTGGSWGGGRGVMMMINYDPKM